MQRDHLGEADPASVQNTLRAFEHLVQDDPNEQLDFVGLWLIDHSHPAR